MATQYYMGNRTIIATPDKLNKKVRFEDSFNQEQRLLDNNPGKRVRFNDSDDQSPINRQAIARGKINISPSSNSPTQTRSEALPRSGPPLPSKNSYENKNVIPSNHLNDNSQRLSSTRRTTLEPNYDHAKIEKRFIDLTDKFENRRNDPNSRIFGLLNKDDGYKQKESYKHHVTHQQNRNIENNYAHEQYANASKDSHAKASMYTTPYKKVNPGIQKEVFYATPHYQNNKFKQNSHKENTRQPIIVGNNASLHSTSRNKNDTSKQLEHMSHTKSHKNTQAKQKNFTLNIIFKIVFSLAIIAISYAVICAFFSSIIAENKNLHFNILAMRGFDFIPLVVFGSVSIPILIIMITLVVKDILSARKDKEAQTNDNDQNQFNTTEYNDTKNDEVNDLQSEESVNTQKIILEYDDHQDKQSLNKHTSTVLQEVYDIQDTLKLKYI